MNMMGFFMNTDELASIVRDLDEDKQVQIGSSLKIMSLSKANPDKIMIENNILVDVAVCFSTGLVSLSLMSSSP